MQIDAMTIIIYSIMIIAILFAGTTAIILHNKTKVLEERLDRFLIGKTAENLEGLFVSLKEDVDFLLEDNKINKKKIRDLNVLSKMSFQKVGLVRYNAYDVQGGERSWVLTLLNYHNSGVIYNCITNNETSILYIRPVKDGKSTYRLSKEEVRSLEKAMDQ
ncbi:MAG: DUF4446 family protein [Eubacteriales bacterium]|nr:DUF4446 family protein [Eubacteriales bacterium]